MQAAGVLVGRLVVQRADRGLPVDDEDLPLVVEDRLAADVEDVIDAGVGGLAVDPAERDLLLGCGEGLLADAPEQREAAAGACVGGRVGDLAEFFPDAFAVLAGQIEVLLLSGQLG
ncbi:hypothetical protein ACFPIJ_28290 [Dactylosporangium cerinum]|uniref:Uncharacterized protein n=1 Tax=Dactylosporangium cerinum TaxID=1434730 RepID=A0ABV9VZ96_9ACTN